MGIALVHSYTAFLSLRLMIGVIGASFVITQYHTSVMFAPNVVGTANAATAGWGNAGGGVADADADDLRDDPRSGCRHGVRLADRDAGAGHRNAGRRLALLEVH